jgi:hypothetical protein
VVKIAAWILPQRKRLKPRVTNPVKYAYLMLKAPTDSY